jgi:hypothetical protein
MGLTSCRWITIAGTLTRLHAVSNRHHEGIVLAGFTVHPVHG